MFNYSITCRQLGQVLEGASAGIYRSESIGTDRSCCRIRGTGHALDIEELRHVAKAGPHASKILQLTNSVTHASYKNYHYGLNIGGSNNQEVAYHHITR